MGQPLPDREHMIRQIASNMVQAHIIPANGEVIACGVMADLPEENLIALLIDTHYMREGAYDYMCPPEARNN